MKISRRTFFIMGSAGTTGALVSTHAAASMPATPTEIEGPFYPVLAQKDKDFDLTRIDGKDGIAAGRVIVIEGSVVDTGGTPVEDATVDLWQANAAGRYRHPHDSNPAPLDEFFQGWAIVPSGKVGEFRFKTVYPGTYPASDGWMRPPHIHFKVSKLGFEELTTQMYFPGHALNDKDLLLKRKSAAEQTSMIATRKEGEPETYIYRIVIEKVAG